MRVQRDGAINDTRVSLGDDFVHDESAAAERFDYVGQNFPVQIDRLIPARSAVV